MARSRSATSCAARTRKSPVVLGAFLEHFAVQEDLAAQMLHRPRDEKFVLGKIAPKERDDRRMELRDVLGAPRTHHDAVRVLSAQCGFACLPVGVVLDAIDLVEHEDTRHRVCADLAEHVLGHGTLPLEARIGGVDHVQQERRFQGLVERRLE